MSPTIRAIEEIEAEIITVFGFYPPMFLPVRDNALQLENFWQHTRFAYIQNPLTATFKEKLAAYLSRYCPVPYCIVCHSCALNALGKSGPTVLALLESPPPSLEELEAKLDRLRAQNTFPEEFPADDSPEERLLIDAATLIYLVEDDGRVHQELRRLLPPPTFQNLLAFLIYVKTVHHWVQTYPEVAYEADKRAAEFLTPLLTSEPALGDFFQVYAAKVIEERRWRTGQRQAAQRLAESEARYRTLAATLESDYTRQRRIADILQRTLLTELPESTLSGLSVAASYVPTSTEALVGGDFFDRIILSDHQVALVAADIAGKGLEAAVHTAEAKFTLRAYLRDSDDPAEILRRMNRFLYESAGGANTPFLCLSLAVINTATGKADFAVAGAEKPLISRTDGRIEEIEVGSVPLGVLPEAEYETATVALLPGDTVALMSDGLTEVRKNDLIFGSEGVKNVLVRDRHQPVEALATAVMEAARGFGGGHLNDDVCLVLARLT